MEGEGQGRTEERKKEREEERELFRRCNSPFQCLVFKNLFLCMCTCIRLHSSMPMCDVVACGRQKRVSDALEAELQVVVNCLTWMLGTILGSFASTSVL